MTRADGLRRPPLGAGLMACLAAIVTSRAALAETPDPSSRDDNYADVWLRLDADRSAGQLWVGGTKSWSKLDLGADLVLTQYYPGAWDPLQNDATNDVLQDLTRAPAVRAELGPALLFGSLFVQPKIGLGYDFELETLGPFVPQVTAVLDILFFYAEAWAQFHVYSPFESDLQDSFYGRLTLLVTCTSTIGLGLQGEIVTALKNFEGSATSSLPVGLAATASLSSALTLGLFAGVDVESSADYRFPGRLTLSYLF